MAAETGFDINGTVYEVPTLDSLDNDECVILYEYSGLVQEDFVPLAEESEEETQERNQAQMKHPGFWKALMHIAYRRQHRELSDKKVKELVGRVNRMVALAALGAEVEEVDGVPPALTSEPPGSSPNDSLENDSLSVNSSVSGGDGSTNDSDPRDVTRALTGTIR